MNEEQEGQQNEQSDTSLEYHFGDFRISRSQQVLIQSENKTIISTKAYYLLMTFLENHGQILKKDDIINAVWPGQFVTDTALTKQIVRLRKLIGDDDSNNPIIETHRGVGYRFAIDVTVHEQKSSTPKIHLKKEKPRVLYGVLGIVLLMVILGVMYMNKTKINSKYTADDTIQTPINLAIIPIVEEQNWLNSSGLDYLSGLLDKNPSINSISPMPEWYKPGDSEKLAIDLTSNKNINYASIIGIIEQDNKFIATIKLRTDDRVIATEKIVANKIADLLIKSNNWITTALSAHEQIADFDSNLLLTVDNYALESYLQGLFQQATDANQKKANDYFQAAINKDADFVDAWVKLVETHVHLGHFEKSIAVAENVINKFKTQLQNSHLIKVHYLIAFAQFRLRNEQDAQDSLRKSIQYVNNSDNPFIKLAGLKSLNLLAYLQKDWPKAEEYALQRVSLAKDYYPFDNYMAGMYLFLSEIVSYQYKFKQSKDYTYLAIEHYEKTNNSNAMITALAGLNQLNYNHHNLDEGVLLTEKAAPYLSTATDPDKVMFFLINSSMILNLRGLFERSEEYSQKMHNIATELNNPLYMVMEDVIKLHRLYVQNKFVQAKNQVKTTLTRFENNPSLSIDLSYIFMFDMLVSARIDEAEKALEKYNSYLKKFPDLELKFPNDLKRVLGHIYVRSDKLREGIKLLEESESANREIFNIHVANYTGFEILEIMLNYPEIDYQATLNRLESLTKYDYLFFKVKAGILARDEKYFEASVIMSENKQKANQLWDADDQLLLEDYQLKSKQ